jgi:hypothetical protein
MINLVELSALLFGVLLGLYTFQQNREKTTPVIQEPIPCITITPTSPQ